MGLSSKNLLVFMVVALMMVSMDLGVMGFKEILVGGHQGWHIPGANETEFYTKWAGKKRFRIGDSLRFQYQNDSVLVVDKYGYYHCDTTKAVSTYNDGNTEIKLEHPGDMYFISGSPDHCQNGMRLIVDVMHPSPAGGSPQASPAPQSPTSQSPTSQQAESPAPAGHANGGSKLSSVSQVSAFLGLLVAASMMF